MRYYWGNGIKLMFSYTKTIVLHWFTTIYDIPYLQINTTNIISSNNNKCTNYAIKSRNKLQQAIMN